MSEQHEATEATTNNNPVLLGAHHDITSFCSTDATRYVLQGVHYDAAGGFIEACDGAALIRVPVCKQLEELPATKAGDATLKDCIVPVAAMKRAFANAKDAARNWKHKIAGYARLSADGDNKATLVTTDLDTEQAVSARCIDGKYPNTGQVWPTTEPTLSIALSSTLLKRVAEYAERAGLDTDGKGCAVRLDFTDENSAVRFSFTLDDAMGEKPKASGVLMPMRLQ